MGTIHHLHRSAPRPFVVIEQPRDYPEEPLYAHPDHYRSLEEEIPPEEQEAASWSQLFFAALCGFGAGVLAVAIPAIIMSWFVR